MIKIQYICPLFILLFFLLSPLSMNAATEFVSTIRESGGDYSMLASWEADVQTNLVATTTRAFSGTLTGSLSRGNTVTVNSTTTHNGITAVVVATTLGGQILVEGATSTEPVVLNHGDTLVLDASNYWTVEGTGAELGSRARVTARIEGSWQNPDTTPVTIDNWGTDNLRYIKIYTDDEARHDGIAGTGYILNPSSDAHAFIINSGYVSIEGIEVTGVTGSSNEAFRIYGNHITIAHNIIYDLTNTQADGVHIGSDGVTTYIYNNLFHNIGRSAILIQSIQNATIYAHNNSVSGGGNWYSNVSNTWYAVIGYDFGSDRDNNGSIIHAKNNICHKGEYMVCYGSGRGGVYSSDSDFNIATDGTSTGGGNDMINQDPYAIFVDPDDYDFRLLSDSPAVNAGVNLSQYFLTDIVGTYRGQGGAWDIGAFEFVIPPDFRMRGQIQFEGNIRFE